MIPADLAIGAGLFLSALGSATILPGGSEATLTALLLGGQYQTWSLVAVASLGNVAGAIVNWWIGRGIERFRDRRWFPVKPAALERAQQWYQRYGKWSLLLSWAPVIGDPLTVIAGVLREPLRVFVLLVGIAKTARYAILAWVVLAWA